MAATPKPFGYLCLVLHAHLPFVRHPECDYFLEENWLFEAITDTYAPLLLLLERLEAGGVPCRITLSLSPSLCSMLRDPFLQDRYARHIGRTIELAEKEVIRTRGEPVFNSLAAHYLDKFKACRDLFTIRSQRDIISRFKRFADAGMLEIITTTATHAYLPAMQETPRAVAAQIQTGLALHESIFGKPSAGFWLPECGYFPGVEHFLEGTGARYVITDTHGILHARPRPLYGTYAPVFCGNTHIAAFGRDTESSRSVWSSKEGYPCDPTYRDFYRDIGFDLELDYIAPYIDPIGLRTSTGMKYYRITGKTPNKELYSFAEATARAEQHALQFYRERENQVAYLASIMDRPPVIVAPFDAELFGHWWYEGPTWLEALIRRIAEKSDSIRMITPTEYLAVHSSNQVCKPSFSSWGVRGYSETWINSANDWIYRHLHSMRMRMTELATAHPDAGGVMLRCLSQMARELMLAESSDWAFIMKTGTMVQYATRRTKDHIQNFTQLNEQMKAESIDEQFLTGLESHNNIFPDIDYLLFSKGDSP